MSKRRHPCGRGWPKSLSSTAGPRFGGGRQFWGRGRQDPGIGGLHLSMIPCEVSVGGEKGVQ